MATGTAPLTPSASLSERAARHLWMHFTKLGADVPILVRGDGCCVWDEAGQRYLDALAALFCVNAGHGRTELADAAAAQAREPAGRLGENQAAAPGAADAGPGWRAMSGGGLSA